MSIGNVLNSIRKGRIEPIRPCVDSQNLSSGTGLLVLKMCKLRKEGYSGEQIVKEIEEGIKKTKGNYKVIEDRKKAIDALRG